MKSKAIHEELYKILNNPKYYDALRAIKIIERLNLHNDTNYEISNKSYHCHVKLYNEDIMCDLLISNDAHYFTFRRKNDIIDTSIVTINIENC